MNHKVRMYPMSVTYCLLTLNGDEGSAKIEWPTPLLSRTVGDAIAAIAGDCEELRTPMGG
jgi:hypothetical protein